MRLYFSYLTLVVLGFGVSGCVSDPVPYERPVPQSQAEIDFALSTLNALQAQSFAQNREICGYIGLDKAGAFIATPPRQGRESSCVPASVDETIDDIASYHTHGAYSDDHDSEFPSADDILGDHDEGIDGYIATPGGRVWYVNGLTQRARLLCEVGCVMADENYVAEVILEMGREYSIQDIRYILQGEDE